METQVDMKWATGESVSAGPDIARTSHIGSVTSFIHIMVYFYEQIQPNLTCDTPQNSSQREVFHLTYRGADKSLA